MDFVTMARLSSDPSWRSEDEGMEKVAWGWVMPALGAVGKWGDDLWRGVKAQRALNAANATVNQAARSAGGRPWYSRLKFWKKPEVTDAMKANPAYRGAEANQRLRQLQLSNATGGSRAGRAGAGMYNAGANTLRFGSAATLPLMGTHIATEPIRNTRHYAHGFTDASTQALEQLSGTPWWKIMALGLGKMMNPDILWDKLVDPVADRNFWSSVSNSFSNGGWRDAGRAAMEVLGAREMRKKRDQIRNLRNNPRYLQQAVDEISAYQKALMEAQLAQQTQS